MTTLSWRSADAYSAQKSAGITVKRTVTELRFDG